MKIMYHIFLSTKKMSFISPSFQFNLFRLTVVKLMGK